MTQVWRQMLRMKQKEVGGFNKVYIFSLQLNLFFIYVNFTYLFLYYFKMCLKFRCTSKWAILNPCFSLFIPSLRTHVPAINSAQTKWSVLLKFGVSDFNNPFEKFKCTVIWIVVIQSAVQEANEFSKIFRLSFWWKCANFVVCDICFINYGKRTMINAALEILYVIRATKTSLDVSSESGVHMITGPDYVMTPYQLQILSIFKGQDIKIFTFPEL